MIQKITQEEFSILKQAIEKYDKDITLEYNKISKNTYLIFGNEDNFVDIREACSDYLLFDGFDKDYNPNKKGVILETLIDKFFTG